jgi:hypothetical protein
MPAQYGTLTSTLDTLLAMRNTTVEDYGEDKAYDAVTALLTAHNEIMNEMVQSLCEFTADKLDSYGGAANGQMTEADEYGAADVQKVSQGVDIGYPLKYFQYAVGWTRLWFQNAMVSEWAAQLKGAMIAHRLKVESEIKKAIFTPTNNLTYKDKRVRNNTLPIRAFLNADSAEIPPDPWGATFNAATHTHYLGTASFVAANLDSLITAVKEHYNTGAVQVDINQAQEATVRGFTGFNAYVDARIRQPDTSSFAQGRDLDFMNIYNRAIGIYNGAEIYVKPWPPATYLFAYNPTQRKPLKFRTRTGTWGGLRLAADLAAFPLYAKQFDDEFGISVSERANGAALKTDNATYSTPANL